MSARIWCTSPSARSCPLWMSRICEVIVSISCSTCDDTTMQRPSFARPLDDLEDAHARQRIAAGERLVEEHDLGVVGHRLRQLGALAHALGVLAEPPVHRVGEVDHAEHLLGARARIVVRKAVQLGQRRDHLEAGEIFVGALVLGAVADAPHAARGCPKPARRAP